MQRALVDAVGDGGAGLDLGDEEDVAGAVGGDVPGRGGGRFAAGCAGCFREDHALRVARDAGGLFQYPVVSGIEDIDIACAIDGQILGLGQAAADGGGCARSLGQLADRVCAGLGDVDGADSIDRHAAGRGEAQADREGQWREECGERRLTDALEVAGCDGISGAVGERDRAVGGSRDLGGKVDDHGAGCARGEGDALVAGAGLGVVEVLACRALGGDQGRTERAALREGEDKGRFRAGGAGGDWAEVEGGRKELLFDHLLRIRLGDDDLAVGIESDAIRRGHRARSGDDGLGVGGSRQVFHQDALVAGVGDGD